MSTGGASGARTVRNAATFVTRILRILGISNAESDSLGLGGLGLTATRQQILGVYTSFKDCVGSHDDLRQVHMLASELPLPLYHNQTSCKDHLPSHLDAALKFKSVQRDLVKLQWTFARGIQNYHSYFRSI